MKKLLLAGALAFVFYTLWSNKTLSDEVNSLSREIDNLEYQVRTIEDPQRKMRELEESIKSELRAEIAETVSNLSAESQPRTNYFRVNR